MRAIKAGAAYIEIFIKNKEKLDAELKTIQGRLQGFAKGVAAAGAALTAISGSVLSGIVAGLVSFARHADDIADAADRIGVTTTSLQQLGYAASQTGASIYDVEAGFRKMEALVGKAANGNKAAAKTLQQYGLSLSALRGMTPEQQMAAFADAIARQPDQARKAAAAMALLGKGGIALLPMLSQGSAGLEAFAKRANELGLVRSEKDIAMGAQLADMWGTVIQQARALADVVGAAVAPAMLKVFTVTSLVLARMIQWVEANRVVVTIVAVAAMVIGALGGVLLGVAGAAWVASAALSAYTIIASAAAAVTAFFASTAGIVTLIVAGVAAALLASVVAWLVFTESGQWAMNTLSGIVAETMGGIFNAIAGGDLALAGKIALNGLLIAFQTFKLQLVTLWENLKTALVVGMTTAMSLVLNQVRIATAAMNATLVAFGGGIDTRALNAGFNMAQLAMSGAQKGRSETAKKNISREKGLLDVLKRGQQNNLTEAEKKAEEAAKPFQFKTPKLPEFGGPAAGPGTGSVGTFSAAVAGLMGRMGQTSAMDKIADNTEQANEWLEGIHESLEDAGLAFD